MPAIISTLTTSGIPGDVFTIDGSSFTDGVLYLFPNDVGETVNCTDGGFITTQTDIQIVGVLPSNLKEADLAWFYIQLPDEDIGTPTQQFPVAPGMMVKASPEKQMAQKVTTSSEMSKDGEGASPPNPTDSDSGPAGSITNVPDPTHVEVTWVGEVMTSPPTTWTIMTMATEMVAVQGPMSEACQASLGAQFYNQPYVPPNN